MTGSGNCLVLEEKKVSNDTHHGRDVTNFVRMFRNLCCRTRTSASMSATCSEAPVYPTVGSRALLSRTLLSATAY